MDNENKVIDFQPDDYKQLAVNKIADELKGFSGGTKEKAVSEFVASTLTHFCEENEMFAEVVYKTRRTLSDCCTEVMSGCGNHISDIDVYRGAVKFYFPNANIKFLMDISIDGDSPSEEEMLKEAKKPTPKKSREYKKSKPKTDKNEQTNKAKTVEKPADNKPIEHKKQNRPHKEDVLVTMQLSLF